MTNAESLADRFERIAAQERRDRRFSGLLDDYTHSLRGYDSMANDDRANRLPLAPDRAGFKWIDHDHGHNWIARSWVASVENAANELHNLIVIHDNGGTASSPKKIKKAARELLRLLGEG